MRLNSPFLLKEDETKHMLKEQTKYNPGYRHEFHENAFPMNTCHFHNSSLIASAKCISHVVGLNSTHQLSCNVALVPTGAIHHIIILRFLSKSPQPSSEPLPLIRKYFTWLYIRILLHTHTHTHTCMHARACTHTPPPPTHIHYSWATNKMHRQYQKETTSLLKHYFSAKPPAKFTWRLCRGGNTLHAHTHLFLFCFLLEVWGGLFS